MESNTAPERYTVIFYRNDKEWSKVLLHSEDLSQGCAYAQFTSWKAAAIFYRLIDPHYGYIHYPDASKPSPSKQPEFISCTPLQLMERFAPTAKHIWELLEETGGEAWIHHNMVPFLP